MGQIYGAGSASEMSLGYRVDKFDRSPLVCITKIAIMPSHHSGTSRTTV